MVKEMKIAFDFILMKIDSPAPSSTNINKVHQNYQGQYRKIE